jgi:murein DD-endopeptidase MepM/ murein hydrolase activator NlpD
MILNQIKTQSCSSIRMLLLLTILFGLAAPVMAEVKTDKKSSAVPSAGKAEEPKFEMKLGLPAFSSKDKKTTSDQSLSPTKNTAKPITFKPAVKPASSSTASSSKLKTETKTQATAKPSKSPVQANTPPLKAITLNGEEDLDVAFLFSTENPEFAPPKETKTLKKESAKPTSKSPAAPMKAASKPNAMGPLADYLTEDEEEAKIYEQMMASVETKVARAKAKRAADLRIAMGDVRTVSRGMFGTRGLGRVPLLAIPVHNAYISSRFGWRSGRPHHGIDLAANSGENIFASSQGTVTHSGWYGGYGNMILIDHGDGVRTLYGHCSSLLVTPGQSVKKGQVIGKVGNTGHSTGPHLHYEVLTNGVPQNPEGFLFR